MWHRITLLLVGSLSSRALRAWPTAPCVGAAVAGTGLALQAGGMGGLPSAAGGIDEGKWAAPGDGLHTRGVDLPRGAHLCYTP
jgi:hypothetical protein